MGIAVLPPDVNESFEGFTVIKNQNPEEKDSIRFGLTTIKNFGEGIASSIIAERKAGGKFISLSDFLRRIKDKNLNKKSLEALIKTGAMDFFGDRGLLLSNLEKIIAFNKEERSKESDQDSLFGGIVEMSQANDILLEPAPLAIPSDKLLWEKELLGLYISGHPLESFKNKLETKATNIKKIKDTAKEREEVVVGGIIEDIRSVVTKKGDKMIFLKFADLTDSIEAVAFPKVFEEFQDILIPESCLVIKGTFSTRNGGKSILIDKAKLLE